MKRSPAKSFKLVTIQLDGLRYGQNARRTSNPAAVARLAGSMRIDGLMHPITVTEGEDGSFTLVSGFRRVEAALLNGWKEIRAVVLASAQSPLLNLVENIQREPLNVADEALAIFKLVSSGMVRQLDVAASLGKNKSSISRLMQLGKLVEKYGEEVSWTKLTPSVYWELLGTPELIVQAELQGWNESTARQEARQSRNLDVTPSGIQENWPLSKVAAEQTPPSCSELSGSASEFGPIVENADGFTIKRLTYSHKKCRNPERLLELLEEIQARLEHYVHRIRNGWQQDSIDASVPDCVVRGEDNGK